MQQSDETSSLETDSDAQDLIDIEDRYLMLGLVTGKIIFLETNNFEQAIARYDVMKDDVQIMRELWMPQHYLALDKQSQLAMF